MTNFMDNDRHDKHDKHGRHDGPDNKNNYDNKNNELYNKLIALPNEEIQLYVLNPKNKKITHDAVNQILETYGVDYKISNLKLFQRAMTHPSYTDIDFKNDKVFKISVARIKDKEAMIEKLIDTSDTIPLQELSYQRLEFLGDSVIHLALAEYLYRRYEDEYEGFMTKLRTTLENGDTLAQLTKIIGLHEYVLMSKLVEMNGNREKNVNILSDVFESFIGALFLDVKNAGKNCYDVCGQLIISIVENEIDFANKLHAEINFKDSLLQYYHRMKWTEPEYDLLEVVGPDTQRKFKMCVKGPDNKIVGIGYGTSKQRGEQNAAETALYFFHVIKLDDDSDEETMVVSDDEDDKENKIVCEYDSDDDK